MGKRQARIERQLAKQLKRQEKSVRLRERPVGDEPRLEFEPSANKNVRLGADPGSIFHMQMTWSCNEPDCEGGWSWGVQRQWSEEDWEAEIKPKLEEWARLTWSEIDYFSSGTGHKMHHAHATDSICDEAQGRLRDIGKYDDEMFRFRLGGKKRLWGFRVVAEFEILWFDPTHDIYPVD